MRFQLWGLLASSSVSTAGGDFLKLAEGNSLAALLGAFRSVVTNPLVSRLVLVDTTANTVQPFPRDW